MNRVIYAGGSEMSKITYTIVCPSCRGKGWISNPARQSSSTQIICPACNGSKTVIATEENEE